VTIENRGYARLGMVTDEQVRRLRKLSNTERNQEIAASKAGMDPTTARRYRGLERLPSELKKERGWRTREDPFSEVWDAVQRQVQESPGLEAKTLFEWLQREYPGRFSDGQIRTLQRRIKLWRVTEGPAQEVYFGQKHMPGRLCASDFTHMTELGITLAGQTFEHLVLPLRADILELGDRHHLLFGEPGKPQRGMAERGLGIGRGGGRAPHR
jgi:hypothetical protein